MTDVPASRRCSPVVATGVRRGCRGCATRRCRRHRAPSCACWNDWITSAIGLAPARAATIPAAAFQRIADEAVRITSQHLAQLSDRRRHTLLAAAALRGRRRLPDNPPLRYVPPSWRPVVLRDGQVIPAAYELCVLIHLRDRLRR